MKNKTRIYIIVGVLILGIFGLLFLINFITGQKNNKKPVKPIASTTANVLLETPTTVVNTNRSISVSKTTKETSSSPARSSSSATKNSSSSSSENSSSSVSSSSVNNDSELDSRLQWKEDCRSITVSINGDAKLQRTNLGDGREIIIASCNTGVYQGQSLVYYYEVATNGRWLSQRQNFWNNAQFLSLPTINSTTLTDFNKFRGSGDCGRLSQYEFNLTSKMFEVTKIQEQDCVPIEQNPSTTRDNSGEITFIDNNLWPVIYERK